MDGAGSATAADQGPTPGGAPAARPGSATRRRADVVVLVLMVVGLVLRSWGIADPPLRHHVPRQLFAAQQARAYAQDLGLEVPAAWSVADQAAKRPEIEPPLLPAVTAVVWRVVGDEPLWVPAMAVVLTWVAGAWVVHHLLRRLLPDSVAAGPAAAAAWLLLPFAVHISRMVLPDPVVVTGVALTAWALVVDDDEPSPRHRWRALALGAATVALKPVAAVFVVPLLAVLAVRAGGWRSLVGRRWVVAVVAVLAPAAAYLVWGTWVAGFLADQQDGRVLPELVGTSWFWSGWVAMLVEVLGVAVLAMVVAGLVVARGRPRAVLGSLLASYVALGLALPYHYRTHDYYHLGVLLVVVVAVGVVVARVERALRRTTPPPAPAVGAAAGLVVLGLMAVLAAARSPVPARITDAEVARHVDRSERLGEVLGHSDRVLWVAPFYGQPAEFWGHLAGAPWPGVADLDYERRQGLAPLPVPERIDDLTDGAGADWLVVLDEQAWTDAEDLRAYVDGRFPVVADTPEWRIYDLRGGGAGA